MTDHSLNAEPSRYEVEGTPAGLHALLAAWRQRSATQWATAVKNAQDQVGRPGAITGTAQVDGRPGVVSGYGFVTAPVDTPRQPNAGALGLEGQEPGVEEQTVTLPELLIPAAIVVVGDKIAEGQLIEAVSLPWFDILKELERDPNFLHQLDWRKVEEMIAGAYKREGWPEVILTHRSGDGGRDIIASRPSVGAIRFYDQVKAYSPRHRVTADEVRALFGVVTRDANVSKGIMTTTATFAPGVPEEWKAYIPYKLELKDGPKLREWLMGLGASTIDPRGPSGK